MNKPNPKFGFAVAYVLIFSGLVLVMIGGLFGFILSELKQGKERAAWQKAFQIAEAGLNYYQWCLNNEAVDNCLPNKDYHDLDGNLRGNFSLNVEVFSSCGTEERRKVTSLGQDIDFSDMSRTLSAFLGKVTVAKYTYLIDDNVWAGPDREIRGFYHSNGGIRMDGENQSLTTSAKENWACTASFGCSSQNCPAGCQAEANFCRCPGIFTTTNNSNPDLFDFPCPNFDFESITVDLRAVKDIAISSPLDRYWPKVTEIDSNGQGYHFKLKNTGQIEVWVITDLNPDYAYNDEEDWHYDYFSIANEYLYKTITIGEGCPVFFVEDNLWVEGTVRGKITIVSAELSVPTGETHIILPGNIQYTAFDGSDGLALIAERDILISPDSPETMVLRGVFVAQKGRFGRNHYPSNIRDKLEINGAIVSKKRVGTKWTSGSFVVSGYLQRENYVDSNLVYEAPPFVPKVSSSYKIYRWQEVEH